VGSPQRSLGSTAGGSAGRVPRGATSRRCYRLRDFAEVSLNPPVVVHAGFGEPALGGGEVDEHKIMPRERVLPRYLRLEDSPPPYSAVSGFPIG
jgi:hypothetical protein